MANLSNNKVETGAGLGHESNDIYVNLIFTLDICGCKGQVYQSLTSFTLR